MTRPRKILYLAANPIGTDRLALDQEFRGIQYQLERSRHGRRFEVVPCWTTPSELPYELRRHKPVVVHFSGHGYRSGERSPDRGAAHRDVTGGLDAPGQEHGLIFADPEGRIRLISQAALVETLAVAKTSIKLVVLNACFTEELATALLTRVPCVVGVQGPIHDDAARHFSSGFYAGIGAGGSVEAAYSEGRLQIHLAGLGGDVDRPQLKVRDGFDPGKWVLAAPPRRRR